MLLLAAEYVEGDAALRAEMWAEMDAADGHRASAPTIIFDSTAEPESFSSCTSASATIIIDSAAEQEAFSSTRS